jgi:hypothetical protein
MRWRNLLNPMTVAFPIFWFPIAIPIFVTTLGALVFDLAQFRHAPPGLDTATMGGGIAAVLLRTTNLSFISTDVWALTTVISYIVRRSLDPLRTVAFVFGAVIAMFWHLLTYLMIALSLGRDWSLSLTIALTVVGGGGLIALRLTVFGVEMHDFVGSSTVVEQGEAP